MRVLALLAYFTVFVSPAAAYFALAGSPWVLASVLVLSFGVHPVVAELLQRSSLARAVLQHGVSLPTAVARIPVLLCLPAHAMVLLRAAETSTSSVGEVLLGGVLCGLSGGILGIAAGHELMHSRSRVERKAGAALLYLCNYPHFLLEHAWHHVAVATPADHDTARKGEALYAFLWRSILLGWLDCFRREQARAHKRHRFATLHNRMVQLTALQFAIIVTLIALSPAFALLFVLQGVVTLLMLKWINYVEHYALDRTLPDGRVLPASRLDAWDTHDVLSNWSLFNLGFHAHHHVAARLPYNVLPEGTPSAAELPGGYARMMVTALVPSLWRRVMDPLAEAQAARRAAA